MPSSKVLLVISIITKCFQFSNFLVVNAINQKIICSEIKMLCSFSYLHYILEDPYSNSQKSGKLFVHFQIESSPHYKRKKLQYYNCIFHPYSLECSLHDHLVRSKHHRLLKKCALLYSFATYSRLKSAKISIY